jgi:surfeit locus 1 family protein
MSLAAAGDGRINRLPGRLYAVCAIAIAVTMGLTALGVWQLQRRVWKLGLIDQIEQRIYAQPVDLPGRDAWPSVTAARDAYRHVRAEGVLLDDRDTLVQAVTELGGGYWLMTPLRTDEGFIVLVNRGFVPADYERIGRGEGEAGRRLHVTGLLRVSEPHGGFLRANDPVSDRWYSRDVEAIARARGLDHVAPYFIDADGSADGSYGSGDGRNPVGGLTVVDLPNNHLVYALTWFSLAAMTVFGMACLVYSEAVVFRRPLRSQRP